MRAIRALLGVAASLFLMVSLGTVTALQSSQDEIRTDSSPQSGPAALKVSLRNEDGSAFIGVASIRVMPSEGYEVPANPTGSDDELLFNNLLPGTYTVEASAPGFLAIRKIIRVAAGSGLQSLFLIMKPRPGSATAAVASMPATRPSTVVPAPADTTTPNRPPWPWLWPGVDESVPKVATGVECPLSQVLAGAGQRMKDLVENLEKFSATEHLEHFDVSAAGARVNRETRKFDYLVTVTISSGGIFQLEEYRNASLGPWEFPSQIATMGLPGMALIFHPVMVSDFDFVCEGLGQWDGHPAWQVHFAQRTDRANRIRAYVIANKSYDVPLKGRAWIDASTYEPRRLESELMKPVPAIRLTQDRLTIDYGPVQFRTHQQELWLPLDAEMYEDFQGRRFYRRHTFDDFKLFAVDSAQTIDAPKESYCFRNTTDRDIIGLLTVSSVSGTPSKVVSLQFTIPSGGTVCKAVGPGKDVGMSVDDIGLAKLMHTGTAGSVVVDAHLTRESVVDVTPEANLTTGNP